MTFNLFFPHVSTYIRWQSFLRQPKCRTFKVKCSEKTACVELFVCLSKDLQRLEANSINGQRENWGVFLRVGESDSHQYLSLFSTMFSTLSKTDPVIGVAHKLLSTFAINPLPYMPILGSSNSAGNKDMMSKIWTHGDTII